MGKSRTAEHQYFRALTSLTRDVRDFLKALDAVMQERESPERGKKVAKLANALEMANDKVRFFTLKEDWRKLNTDTVDRETGRRV